MSGQSVQFLPLMSSISLHVSSLPPWEDTASVGLGLPGEPIMRPNVHLLHIRASARLSVLMGSHVEAPEFRP